MKLAVFSESSADEGALRILSAALLTEPSEPSNNALLRIPRGWHSVPRILPKVIQNLYYYSDADGLVVSVDSDNSPIHTPDHEQAGNSDDRCRLCQLLQVATKTLRHLSPKAGRPPLRLAIGLAVPCIEAWLRCGLDHTVTESAWVIGQRSHRPPYDTNSLKRAVYGRERADLPHMTECMAREATRIAQDIPRLETAFPNGFGHLARQLRTWQQAAEQGPV